MLFSFSPDLPPLFQASTTDLPALAASLADREAAIRAGLNLDGLRFEVHRHYPPLVYGWAMGADTPPERAEGVALCAAGGQWSEGGSPVRRDHLPSAPRFR